MPGLPPKLLKRLRKTLLACEEFNSNELLGTVFVNAELEPFAHFSESDRKKDRVDLLIKYLLPKFQRDGRSALVLFLKALADRYPVEDSSHKTLPDLAAEVELALSQREPFCLRFANREAEKDAIHARRRQKLYVQIYAPGGLGKTFLLDEIRRHLKDEGSTVIWLDFTDGQKHCVADMRALIIEFYRQLNGQDAPTPLNDLQLLEYAGKCLANTQQAALILDNADRLDKRALEWLRATFFEEMAHYAPLWVLASGQQVIPEWQGHRAGRPFELVPLSEFNDDTVIALMIDDLTARCGVEQARQRRTAEEWQQELPALAAALWELSCGHPLAMERLLYDAWQHHGALRPDYLTRRRAELVRRCLAPLIGERILPKLDSVIREAFRSLCIFRAVWPGLIRALLAEGDWPPLTDNDAPADHWWRLLQTTPLIGDVNPRQLYPLSPIVRRLIALVLEYEDPDLFRARHARARAIYSQMATDAHVALLQRAACWLEALFHAAKSGDDVAVQATLALLPGLQALPAWEEVQPQVTAWWDEDAELRALAAHFLDPDWSIG